MSGPFGNARAAARARLRHCFGAVGAGALTAVLLPNLFFTAKARELFPIPPEGMWVLAPIVGFGFGCLLTCLLLRLSPRDAFAFFAPNHTAGGPPGADAPSTRTKAAAPRGLLLPGIFCCLGMSAVGVTLSRLLGAALEALTGLVPAMPVYEPPAGAWGAALYMARIALLPALLEECFFRGAALAALRPFGERAALVATSIFFALAHGNLVQAPNAFVTGMVLGYFALRGGGLPVPVIMHFVNNATAALVTLGGLALSPRAHSALAFFVHPLYCVLGFAGVMMLWRRGGERLSSAAGGLTGAERLLAFATAPAAVLFLLVCAFNMAINLR